MEVSPKKYKTYRSDVNYSNKKAYNQFLKETKRSDITYEMFSKIPQMVHERMISKMYSGAYSVRIPKLGLFRLLKVAPFGEPHATIDWGRYRKTGIWAPYRNTHTDGYIYKVHLYSYSKKFPELGFFRFRLAIKHQRHLAQLIKNNEIHR
jgi:hypothetical protein